MKNSINGFTLAELLAVVVVLGILVVIISPTVINLINDSSEGLSKTQMDMLINASKKYMIDHSELLPEGDSTFSVNVSSLVSDGVIDNEKVIDPKTGDEIQGCVVVSYNSNFNQYEYNYSSNC